MAVLNAPQPLGPNYIITESSQSASDFLEAIKSPSAKLKKIQTLNFKQMEVEEMIMVMRAKKEAM